ncbi:Gfo/Idh/MocA family protein [Phyllobacterium endophyticum]|uniref:Fructose reductase n=1 Tax=Phyllobacterium endophyticum TaxID=1149773 RepID=A0A2P7AS26_9HYPH|nr:Gfo/Idh/MocA family oxidoreductase [Phyllobacterium endophyticum]MBB3236757.1 1,5-anhydro-D-fructose reductase (1,5-anhydro-D-mannitol-forming) [Phyllobacterium endophyticum]PSH57036.1 fructose reductase [Phyllobacterium endophyticum]TYR40315.1 Gfo/Idh/MocA family oxidoreductase [Phyllobacterium endophyticum]
MMKNLKWGLIGASRIGAEWIIPAIRSTPGNEIVAVQGGDALRVSDYARNHSIANAFTSVEELLAADLDAVYISNTNEKHAPCAIAALNAGKHVLGEKPMATSLDEAKAMVALAHEKGLTLAINHHLRGMNSHRKLRDLVESGALGELVAVRAMFGVLLPQANRGWRTESAVAGAGVFFDLTVHDADSLHFILGEKFKRVATFTSNNGVSAEGIEDGVAIVAQTASGLTVQITESFAVEHAKTSLELHGTTASVFAEGVLLQSPGGKLELSIQGERQEIKIEHENAYPRVIAAFATAAQGKGRPLVSGEDGLASLQFAIAARQAAETHQVVEI